MPRLLPRAIDIQYEGYPLLLIETKEAEQRAYGWSLELNPVLSIDHIHVGEDDITGMGHLVVIQASSREQITDEYLNLPKGWKWTHQYLDAGQYFDDYGYRIMVFKVEKDGKVSIVGGRIE